jgi:hypothetical protein
MSYRGGATVRLRFVFLPMPLVAEVIQASVRSTVRVEHQSLRAGQQPSAELSFSDLNRLLIAVRRWIIGLRRGKRFPPSIFLEEAVR